MNGVKGGGRVSSWGWGGEGGPIFEILAGIVVAPICWSTVDQLVEFLVRINKLINC